MKAEKKPDNIIRHSFRTPVSFVSVFFVLMLIYFLIQGILFLTRPKISAYNIGAPETDNAGIERTGLILRDDTAVYADRAGTVTLFVPSGERISADKLFAVIDSDGILGERIVEAAAGREFPDAASARVIQDAIRKGIRQYDGEHFADSAGVQASVSEAVLECLIAGGDDFLNGNAGPDKGIRVVRTETSGFCMYWKDGLEGKTAEELTAEDFVSDDSRTVRRKSGDSVENGDFLMKIAPENAFSLVFPLSGERELELTERKTLTVQMEDDVEITGDFSVTEGRDGTKLGVLHFQKYGSNYMDSRDVSFRIIDKGVTGFKIPESAIVTKDYFAVPAEYIARGGEDNVLGVMVVGTEKGGFIPVSVYAEHEDDAEKYIYSEELESGMVLMQTDGHDTIGTASVILGIQRVVEGVYQINSGYCVFRPVCRLSTSVDTDYVIISSDSVNGPVAFDRIVLNAADTSENEIIYD